MATQKFLVTTDNTDMTATDMRALIEYDNSPRIGRPVGTAVVDVSYSPYYNEDVAGPTTNLVWQVQQDGNVIAACHTAEDALNVLRGLASFTADGLTGWSIHFNQAVV